MRDIGKKDEAFKAVPPVRSKFERGEAETVNLVVYTDVERQIVGMANVNRSSVTASFLSLLPDDVMEKLRNGVLEVEITTRPPAPVIKND